MMGIAHFQDTHTHTYMHTLQAIIIGHNFSLITHRLNESSPDALEAFC